MQFTIGVTILECSFVKHSHGPLGVKWPFSNEYNILPIIIFSNKLSINGMNFVNLMIN
jgi:hypothetical protein